VWCADPVIKHARQRHTNYKKMNGM
jgi:hypothetical protein